MTQKDYTVEGRQFRTQSDYARALHDKKIIDELRGKKESGSKAGLEVLLGELEAGKYRFMTILGEDFREEVQEALTQAEAAKEGRKKIVRKSGSAFSGSPPGEARKTGSALSAEKKRTAGRREARRMVSGSAVGRDRAPEKRAAADSREKQENKSDGKLSEEMKAYVQEELKRQEKRRKSLILLCSAVAVCCLGYFGLYSWHHYKTGQAYDKLSQLKEMPVIGSGEVTTPTGPLFTLDEPAEPREVLDEYKNLLNKNKKLIGWVKIDDTNIDYPVMQTSDNEYYLTHNLNQENDRNGSIFMDKDCDVLKPSTNYIIYGHHMKSGNMFGKLDLYQDENYCKEHPYIQFDTIYEKGTYEVMYVFRSRVYREEEIVFKYYQFIDANSEQEFDSYMSEMASMSLYDTGVTAEYGDQLLTLSTCDYQEKNGRFVVVAKKVKE